MDSVFSFHTTQKRRAVKRCIGSALCISEGVGGTGWGIKVLVISEHSLVCGWVDTICSTLGTVGTYIGTW